MAWDSGNLGAGLSLSNSDQTVTDASSGYTNARSIQGRNSGKWYFETYFDTENNGLVGLINEAHSTSGYAGDAAGGWSVWSSNGNKFFGGSATALLGAWEAGETISVAVDFDSGKVWFARNGTWGGSGDPESGTNEAFSGVSGTLYASAASFSSDVITLREIEEDFAYSLPTGFEAWGKPDVSHHVAGTVKQDGSSVSREIRVIDASNGELLATADSIGGSFDIGLQSADPVFVQAIPAEGYRPLIKGPLTPAEIV